MQKPWNIWGPSQSVKVKYKYLLNFEPSNTNISLKKEILNEAYP